ncbi:hypothetical protein EAG_13801 [Camponotus floridanus]|uniref:Uncharacterized protein n=1 Tax=Camponotus floridanus TaxID=104421 RepID=E2A3C4_CAMFO|nr:hypothetical protein EAG_13801 [Camponotus floridanus]
MAPPNRPPRPGSGLSLSIRTVHTEMSSLIHSNDQLPALVQHRWSSSEITVLFSFRLNDTEIRRC